MNQLVEQKTRREFAVVQSPLAIFDTARFEQMTRIAQVMAECALIPESLQGVRKGNDFEMYPPKTILANCFLVVSYAERLGFDPFLVAQSCSVVRGRLMFEGKLIAAALDDKLGVTLRYEFGKWDPKTETCVIGAEGEGEMLAVRVTGHLPATGEIVSVDGSVGVWKSTGDKSPWRPGAYKRMLRYRGAREWARAHQPAIMLGVYGDDEMEDLAEDFRARRAAPVQQQPSLSERLGAPTAESSGFSRAHVDRETADTAERSDATTSSATADTEEAKTLHERDVSKVAAEASAQAAGKTLVVAGGDGQVRGHSAAAGAADRIVTEEGEVVKERLPAADSENTASTAHGERVEATSQDPPATDDDPEPPEAKTPDEYAAAVRWRIRHADNAEALVAKWNSATEKNRRNKLGIEPYLRDALKAEVMARANELRAAG